MHDHPPGASWLSAGVVLVVPAIVHGVGGAQVRRVQTRRDLSSNAGNSHSPDLAMAHACKPALWQDVFVMIGTSAGAWVGLLFVVMSLHMGKIDERSDDDMRAIIDGARHDTIHLLSWKRPPSEPRPQARNRGSFRMTVAGQALS